MRVLGSLEAEVGASGGAGDVEVALGTACWVGSSNVGGVGLRGLVKLVPGSVGGGGDPAK